MERRLRWSRALTCGVPCPQPLNQITPLTNLELICTFENFMDSYLSRATESLKKLHPRNDIRSLVTCKTMLRRLRHFDAKSRSQTRVFTKFEGWCNMQLFVEPADKMMMGDGHPNLVHLMSAVFMSKVRLISDSCSIADSRQLATILCASPHTDVLPWKSDLMATSIFPIRKSYLSRYTKSTYGEHSVAICLLVGVSRFAWDIFLILKSPRRFENRADKLKLFSIGLKLPRLQNRCHSLLR